MIEDLPPKLREYVEFILGYISERGFQPSDREAAQSLEKDKSTIVSYKKKLEEMGVIKRTRNGRSIEILNDDYFSKLGYTRISKTIINTENSPSIKQAVEIKGTKKLQLKPISKDTILARVLLTLYQIWDKLDVLGLDEMLPVPVESILEEEKYRLKRDVLQTGISGLLLVKDRIVVINNQDSPQRQRFTIAHEIGHIKLHNAQKLGSIGNIICVSSPSQKEVIKRTEWEADYFAANLLVPLDKLKEYIRFSNIKEGEEMNSEKLTRMVSEKFNVSFSVAESRLEKINIYNLHR